MQKSAITNSSDLNLRSKGLNLSYGKIHKGCVKDAATKLSIGSIPSTYESIIYKSDNKKAFGTSQQRFYNKQKDQCQKIIDSHEPSFAETETTNASQSCNTHNIVGYGPFISKSKRQWFRTIKTPGPGQYSWANQEQFKTQIARKCFTRQEKVRERILFPQENKQNLIETQIDEKQVHGTPGPGQYQCDGAQNWKKVNKGWKSAFQTRVTRNHYIPVSITPGPGVYDHCPKKKSPKQSNIEKKQANKSPSKNKLLAEIIKEEKDEVPGPGSYNHELPDFKPLYEKIKLSKNFMAPLTAGKKNKVKGPTATHYNVKRMFEDISPKLIESAVFMSESKRLPFQSNSKNLAEYINPPNQKKQNFHFNIRNEWM